jgi:hypothetical protein
MLTALGRRRGHAVRLRIPRLARARAWDASFEVAVTASPFVTYACVDSWLTDFRDDLPKIDVPVPAIHGTADRILALLEFLAA